MPKVVIVGSAPVDLEHLRRLCRGAAQVICADGGAGSVLAAGIMPTAVVGDFDSLAERDRKALASLPIAVYRHSPEKDQTDLELALQLAMERAVGRIFMVGVLGGRRTDHGVGNLLLLSLESLASTDVIIDEGRTEACVVRRQRRFFGSPGDYISLLPISEEVRGISTEGLRYPLRDESLWRGHTRGVSNEFVATSAMVIVSEGCLLVIHERAAAGPAE